MRVLTVGAIECFYHLVSTSILSEGCFNEIVYIYVCAKICRVTNVIAVEYIHIDLD